MSHAFETVSDQACFGGRQLVLKHQSPATGTEMAAALYLPPQAGDGPVPLLVFLSGLTCTWENVTTKAGAQAWCAEAGLGFLAPDTSPRGDGVADDDAYDLGQGAGFYVDASQAPWAPHFMMESYIIRDLLPGALKAFPLRADRVGITGHSMGGHGALSLAMKYPDTFQSLSAFAPIVNPARVPWGTKALGAYLGNSPDAWASHDACALARQKGWKSDILIDIGLSDPFLEQELTPERFEAATAAADINLTLRRHAGYDHSYYMIASFMEDHITWHQDRLTDV